jgi:hypothetical protein
VRFYPGRNVALSSQPAQVRLLPHVLARQREQSVSGLHTAGWIADAMVDWQEVRSGAYFWKQAELPQKLHLVPVEMVLGDQAAFDAGDVASSHSDLLAGRRKGLPGRQG